MTKDYTVQTLSGRKFTVSADSIEKAEDQAFSQTTEKVTNITEANSTNPSFICFDLREKENVSRHQYARRRRNFEKAERRDVIRCRQNAIETEIVRSRFLGDLSEALFTLKHGYSCNILSVGGCMSVGTAQEFINTLTRQQVEWMTPEQMSDAIRYGVDDDLAFTQGIDNSK